jgi:hypothetical protein
VFLRGRDDRPPEECVRPGEEFGTTEERTEAAEAGPLVVDKAVRFTNLTKVFWPEASATVIFVIMAIVLLARPAGLFGRA